MNIDFPNFYDLLIRLTEVRKKYGSFNIVITSYFSLIHHWAIDTPITRTVDLLEITEANIIEWFARMRDVCNWWNQANPITVGGPGLVVEIDEASVNHSIPHAG